VHVAGGVPSPIILSGKKPHWTNRLSLFNPISILWRYYAILDRRIRWSSSWNGTVLAASNAIFWREDHWDGSEEMIGASSHFLPHTPTATRNTREFFERFESYERGCCGAGIIGSCVCATGWEYRGS
jgi:hypothetical protein